MLTDDTEITFTGSHGFQVGDIIRVSGLKKSKGKQLYELFKRPRISYVKSFTVTTMNTAMRKMSWSEWREAIKSCFS